MPIIDVKILSGRTQDQKRALMRELAEGTVRALGVSRQSIRIVLTEVEADNWGVGGVSKFDLEREGQG